MAWSRLNSAGQPVDDRLVEVVAAEVVVTRGGLDLEDAVADLEDGHVERAAAEVEDEDRLVGLLVEAVGERRGGRLVDDALDVEAGDLAGVLGRLALVVVEVRRDGDDRAVDRVAEIGLGVGLELLQDHRADLRRAVLLAARVHARVAVGAADDLVRDDRLLLAHLGLLAAHEALDREDGVLRIGDGLALGDGADEAVAVLREGDDGRGGAPALDVLDDGRLAALEDGHARVRRAEVDPDGLAHVVRTPCLLVLYVGNLSLRLADPFRRSAHGTGPGRAVAVCPTTHAERVKRRGERRRPDLPSPESRGSSHRPRRSHVPPHHPRPVRPRRCSRSRHGTRSAGPGPVAPSSPVAASCTATPSTTCRTSRTRSGTTAYEQAISGDTKGDLPRAIAPAGTPAATPATPTTPVSAPTASNDDSTNGWQIAALGRGRRPRGLRARRGRPRGAPPAPRSPHGGVEERIAEGAGPFAAPLPSARRRPARSLRSRSQGASRHALSPHRGQRLRAVPRRPRRRHRQGRARTSATCTTPSRSSPPATPRPTCPARSPPSCPATPRPTCPARSRPRRRHQAQHGREHRAEPRRAHGRRRRTATRDERRLAAGRRDRGRAARRRRARRRRRR